MRNPSVCFPAGILLILVASLVPFTNSFVTPLHKASFQIPCDWNWQGGVHSFSSKEGEYSVPRWRRTGQQATNACRCSLGAKKNTDEATNNNRTKVEDASPLGVAIVALGSFLFLGDSGDAGDTVKAWVGDDLPVAGVILVTASLAAGISRLVRRQLRR